MPFLVGKMQKGLCPMCKNPPSSPNWPDKAILSDSKDWKTTFVVTKLDPYCQDNEPRFQARPVLSGQWIQFSRLDPYSQESESKLPV